MLCAALAEIVSLGAILPFLGMLTQPERVFYHPYVQPLVHLLDLTEARQLLLPLTLAFCCAAVAAGMVRLVLLWAQIRLTYALGMDIATEVYRRSLYQPYLVHVGRNSSEVLSAVTDKPNIVTGHVLTSLLNLISSCVIAICIFAAILAVQPVIALLAVGSFGLLYAVKSRLTGKRLVESGKRISIETSRSIKIAQEGLGGIRDVLLSGAQQVFFRAFYNSRDVHQRAVGNTLIMATSPRYVVESFGLVLFAVLAYVLANGPKGLSAALPLLGVMALAAQRLLPLAQNIYQSFANMRSGQAALCDVLDLLDQPLPATAAHTDSDAAPLVFTRSITLSNLCFRYSANQPLVLKELNLVVHKGSRIGFVGTTGSGKTTLLDIILGLLAPTTGQLLVDDCPIHADNQAGWQKHIAHVPQDIFLVDGSIAENIAFAIRQQDIDMAKVQRAARLAQIDTSIEQLPNGYQSLVGERGVRLSGGQRQRIGIARALYREADVIVFDEATSALDTDTETSLMQAIDGLSSNLTILMIAHRLSTLKNCERIMRLQDGKLIEQVQDEAD